MHPANACAVISTTWLACIEGLDCCRIAAHAQKHQAKQEAAKVRISGEVAPLAPEVVSTLDSLPPIHELPPVVLPSSAALKKSVSSGSALHGQLDQKVQQASVKPAHSPLAGHAVHHQQHAPADASSSAAAAAGHAAAAAHLKQSLNVVSASGSSFTTLMQSAKARPPQLHYIDSGEVLPEEDRTKAGIKIRMKHYFTKQKGLEVPSS